MTFAESIRTCLNNYATFDGRARRSEFWWFYLFNQICSGIPMFLGILLLVLGMVSDPVSNPLVVAGWVLIAIATVTSLGLIVPLLAAGCRRLHDRGMSGWLQLLLVISLVQLVVIVFWALPGNPGDNQYGPAQ